jgi:hypothetical protein
MRSVFLMGNGRQVAIGGQDVWTSDDDGHSWDVRTVFPAEAGVSGMMTDDGTLLAISAKSATDDATLWTSADGKSWKRIGLTGIADSSVLAMVELDGATYLAVEDRTDVPATRHELFRLSPSNEPQVVSVEGGAAAYIGAMAASAQGIVAVGHIGEGTPTAVWVGR